MQLIQCRRLSFLTAATGLPTCAEQGKRIAIATFQPNGQISELPPSYVATADALHEQAEYFKAKLNDVTESMATNFTDLEDDLYAVIVASQSEATATAAILTSTQVGTLASTVAAVAAEAQSFTATSMDAFMASANAYTDDQLTNGGLANIALLTSTLNGRTLSTAKAYAGAQHTILSTGASSLVTATASTTLSSAVSVAVATIATATSTFVTSSSSTTLSSIQSAIASVVTNTNTTVAASTSSAVAIATSRGSAQLSQMTSMYTRLSTSLSTNAVRQSAAAMHARLGSRPRVCSREPRLGTDSMD